MDKEKYFELCRILNLQYDPENRFLPGKFFREFDFAIPHLGSQINKAVYYEVARYRRDVEESDKIYFMGWLDNDKQAHRVTEQNLQKTRRLLDLTYMKLVNGKILAPDGPMIVSLHKRLFHQYRVV